MASSVTNSMPEAGDYLYKGEAISHEDEKSQLQQLTVENAVEIGIDPIIPVYVIQHESGWDVDAVGDHGAAVGCAQFHKPTFEEMKQKANLPLLQYKSCGDQIILMEWAIKNNLGDRWTTYRKFMAIQ